MKFIICLLACICLVGCSERAAERKKEAEALKVRMSEQRVIQRDIDQRWVDGQQVGRYQLYSHKDPYRVGLFKIDTVSGHTWVMVEHSNQVLECEEWMWEPMMDTSVILKRLLRKLEREELTPPLLSSEETNTSSVNP